MFLSIYLKLSSTRNILVQWLFQVLLYEKGDTVYFCPGVNMSVFYIFCQARFDCTFQWKLLKSASHAFNGFCHTRFGCIVVFQFSIPVLTYITPEKIQSDNVFDRTYTMNRLLLITCILLTHLPLC